jgi:glycosyltransferase involved in cell wall biosynthesis
MSVTVEPSSFGQPGVRPGELESLIVGPALTDPLRGLRLLMVAHSNSTHTHRWSKYFQARGMQVLVLSPLSDTIDGITIKRFPPARRWYHRLRGLHVYIDFPHWKSIFAQFKPDVVHVHYPDGGPRSRFYFAGIDRLVTSTWGSEVVESEGYRLSEKHKIGVRATLEHSKVVTATTRFLAQQTALYCQPGTPIHIIPFGVDCEIFKPLVRPADDTGDIRIGFIKNLERKYGPEVLIDAFAKIVRRCPRARLIMAGKGDEGDALQARVRELGLSHRVDFPGRLPHEQVVALVQSLHLMAMPSTCQESFGVAAIEASACEVPVVATRVGGVPEAVVHGETGLLVPPYDVDAFADACIELIEDEPRRRRIGQAGRRFVQETYPWQRNAQTMGSVYEQLIAGGKVTTAQMITAGA